MKKYFIFLFLSLFLLFVAYISLLSNIAKETNEYDMSVMGEIRTYNLREDEYELIFDEEVLNLSNFKLKMALFSSSNCNIKKVYINYPYNVQEYFKDKEYISVTGNNLNYIIDLIREEYTNILKENNNYEDGYTDNNISINKVVIQSGAEVINKFKIKYPNVKIKSQ